MSQRQFSFAIDRGGTFTDVYAEVPGEPGFRVLKLLSIDPQNYPDAPTEGIRRILSEILQVEIPRNAKIPTKNIKSIRMGTTVATNALLERKGERVVMVTGEGFEDILKIGNQSRPKIFDLKMRKPKPLYEKVIQCDARVRIMSAQTRNEPINKNNKVVEGVTGDKIEILKPLNKEKLRKDLQNAFDEGFRSVAIVFIHSYTFPHHEQEAGEIAKEIGFTQISLSSSLMSMIKLVPRGQTCCIDAYLTPLIKEYLNNFVKGFDEHVGEVDICFMMSDGGLCPMDQFNGYKSILSGPAGGVVGYAVTSYDGKKPVIGFDMGGTSTDVSRFDGEYVHVYDSVVDGIPIQSPQLDINTVAAGGGRNGLFVVGPESAGAHPGPICYRKNGYLTVTDANLVVGRLLPDFFPKIFGPHENEGLDVEAARTAFETLAKDINAHYKNQDPNYNDMSVEEVAMGFLRVANESMCRPIRAITEAKGYSTSHHVLSVFGGAGPQNACAVAKNLMMKEVFIHRFAGILSAYGLQLADVVHENQEPANLTYGPQSMQKVNEILEKLKIETEGKLLDRGYPVNMIKTQEYLNLRYDGTDTAIMTKNPANGNYQKVFIDNYKREFGFVLEGRDIKIDDIRVRSIGKSSTHVYNSHHDTLAASHNLADGNSKNCGEESVYFDGQWVKTKIFKIEDLFKCSIRGPAIVIDKNTTIVIEPDCDCFVNQCGDARVIIHDKKSLTSMDADVVDPILLSVFSHRFMSIAEQMGKTLQRTSISTNIKERLDFSCALFDDKGGLVANAPHLPVHMGAMQEAVRFQIKHLGKNWHEGEVIVTNHPIAGGSHLPDITVITPVYSNGRPVFYVASRGHHADIGGITPGSMPPFSRSIDDEGAHIISFKLVIDGVFQEEGITKILTTPNTNVKYSSKITNLSRPTPTGTRNLKDNISDLKAQIAANQKGIKLVGELIEQYGLTMVNKYMNYIQQNAEDSVREMLKAISISKNLPPIGILESLDYMDDGSAIKLKLTIDREKGTAIFDFRGSGLEVYGNFNSPKAVTYSAIIYCLRCLVNTDIPLNQGCLNPIVVEMDEGSILSPSDEAAVVGGNVLTSQRVTDVILEAFGAAACSQGCMNNFTFGNDEFGYYETIAGGAGALPGCDGESGVHSHMTNTRITDAEILEKRYPVLLHQFTIRKGSGGDGKYRGGDGVIREMEFLDDLVVGILSERRVFAPKGMNGGENAKRGENTFIRKNGKRINVGGKNMFEASCGDRFLILSPGGGGYGSAE